MLKTRLEHPGLNTIILGTFAALTSVIFYKHSLIAAQLPDKVALIDVDQAVLAVLLLLLAVVSRYVGYFAFIHACPSMIQSNRDIDDLLKKSKDTIVDQAEWPNQYNERIRQWDFYSYRRPAIRTVIGVSELMVLLFYCLGLVVFVKAVWRFALLAVQAF